MIDKNKGRQEKSQAEVNDSIKRLFVKAQGRYTFLHHGLAVRPFVLGRFRKCVPRFNALALDTMFLIAHKDTRGQASLIMQSSDLACLH